MRITPLILLLLAAISPRAAAVILYTTPTRNTHVPGTLANRDAWNGPAGSGDPRRLLNSGWQYQGLFGIYRGTPIAPSYFITAQHIGGNVGDQFIHRNLAGQDVVFTTNGVTNIPGTDLRVWQIDGIFDHYAPMWDESVDGLEAGRPLVVIGRGTERGAEVIVGGMLKGWEWGIWDTVQSWGENVVTDVVVDDDFGALLQFDFNAEGGPNEAALSAGDSGGGVFLQSEGIWKLAGINLGVAGPWRTSANGTNFNASIFDAAGLYLQLGDPPPWQMVPDGIVGASFSSRISSSLDSINGAMGMNSSVAIIPEPCWGWAACGVVLGLRRPAVPRRGVGGANGSPLHVTMNPA